MKSAASVRDLLSPYEAYRSMRGERPVHRDEQFHAWHVYRYADVDRVLADHRTFRSNLAERGDRPEPRRSTADPGRDTMLRADPPRHRQLRGLVSMAFTPPVVDRMAPRIRAITDTVLDRALHRGEFDVVADLAYPLPVIVICELLGVAAERRTDFKRWSDAVLAGGCDTPGPDAGEVAGMYDYFAEVLERRRREPGDDLISRLLAAEVDGRRLSTDELLSFCGMMLVAGHETTTNLIGNAVLCLDAHPDLPDRLRADPALLAPALEEVMRYLSPVQIVVRYAATDTVIGGQPVRAGELVFPVIGSANRDEAQFTDPDRFDPHRTPNRHLALGHGIHFCLGASLARLEARIALAAMLERLPGRWEVPDVSLDPLALRFLFGVRRLPLRWNA